jgi:hypothetical protein
MITNNAWNSPDYSAYQAHNFTGIEAWSGAGVYYSVSGTNFTVERGGTGYIKTTPITWAGGQTVSSLSAGNTHYIYIDSTGTIGSTTTRNLALFQDNINLFEVLVDNDTPANVIVVREDHPVGFPADSSEWAHVALGPLIGNVNNGANIVLNGTTGVQINGTDILLDHGLTTTIPDSSGAAVTWNFMYTDGTGKWVQYLSQTAFPAFYNNAGTPTALAGNQRGIFRLYVSKDDLNSSTPQYFAVMDDAVYANYNAASAAVSAGSTASPTNELYALELAQLGYVIFSSGVIEEVDIAKATARFFPAGGGAALTANLVSTNTSNFDHILSSGDSNVQIAFDTLDESGIVWAEVTGTSQTADTNWGYIVNNAALVTVTLPSTCAVGKRFYVTGKGAGGWTIAQNAGQTIHLGSSSTTTGVGGSLSSTNRRDTLEMVCVTADTDFSVLNYVGTITVV